MDTFEGFGLKPALANALTKMGYTTPTPIQAQSIPLALKGHDIMGSAQTGTGKTAAYAIPAIQHLMESETSTALVLTPTRELGKQVMEIMKDMLGPKSNIKTAFIIGGEPYRKQMQQLDKRPRLIVGTPGRINDHLERGSLEIDLTDFLILDETDRMLDMGFSVQLDRIFKYLPEERQTLMFSATLPDEIMNMSKKYLTKPERVAVGSTIEPSKNISQEVIKIDDDKKYDELKRQLGTREGSVIMFVKTKFGTERMAKRLKGDGFEAQAIHGDLKQTRRERVIGQFRDNKFRILVATDVVARGLDIPHVRHVVNYDLPQVPEDFIHRIGRTARAGAKGEALSFVSPREGRKWHAIEMLLDPDAVPDHFAGGGRGGNRKPRSRSGGGGKRGSDKYRKPNKRAALYGDKNKKRDSESDRGGKKPFKKKFSNSESRDDDRSANKKPYKSKFAKSESRDDSKSFSDKKKPYKSKFSKSETSGNDNKPSDKKKPYKSKFAKSDSHSNDGQSAKKKKKPYNKDGASKSGEGKKFNSEGKFKKFAKGKGKAAGAAKGQGSPVKKGKGSPKPESFKSKSKTGSSKMNPNRPIKRKAKQA